MPDLVWSGLVGALIALLSALLTNWGHNRRQKQQLDHDLAQRKAQLGRDEERQRIQLAHDSEEHQIGREMTFRRDVYLAAAEAIGSLQEYIANSSRADVSEADRLSLIKGSTGVLNKVHLVGSTETIKAFSGVQRTFARAVFSVEEQRLAILKTNFRLDALRREVDNLQGKRADLAETLNACDETHDVVSLLQEFRSTSEAIEQQLEAVAGENERLFDLQLELGRRTAKANLEILEAFVAAVLTLRAELGLALDVAGYQESMAEHRSLLQAEFDAFVERVRGEASSE